MDLDKIIKSAYDLYMPQVKNEITSLAKFVYDLNPNVIVEIGTKYGGTFMIWNEISNDITVSIDLTNGVNGGVNSDSVVKRNEFFKNKYGNKCFFIEGSSHNRNTYDSLIKILNGKPIDFLFIDGDHSYEGVKKDYEIYSPLVKSGGFIAFHDINDSERHRNLNVYVNKLWIELKGEKIEFNEKEDWAGIGVIKHI